MHSHLSRINVSIIRMARNIALFMILSGVVFVRRVIFARSGFYRAHKGAMLMLCNMEDRCNEQ